MLSAGAAVAEAAPAGNNDSGGNSSGIGKPGNSSAKSPANSPSNFKAAGGTGNSADAKSGGNPSTAGSPGAAAKTGGNAGVNAGANAGANAGKPTAPGKPVGSNTGKPASPGNSAASNAGGRSAVSIKPLPESASPVAVAASGKTQSAAAPETPSPVPPLPAPGVAQVPASAPVDGTPAGSPYPGQDSGREGVPAGPTATVTRPAPDPAAPGAAADAAIPADPVSVAALSSPPSAGPGGDPVVGAASSPQDTVKTAVARIAHTIVEALREVSLKDLALAALPGIAGLLFFFATGVGMGHRQARFGFAIEPTGTLRFLTPGVLGVVRSGHSVAVRTARVRRGVRPHRGTTDRAA